ncbi:hypothetical protein ACLB2K_006635 [Fragaria x ananassa]
MRYSWTESSVIEACLVIKSTSSSVEVCPIRKPADCNWSRTKLLEFLDASIVDQTCGIPIPSTNQLDAFIWGPCLNGEFTIRSYQSSDLDRHDQSPLLKKIWLKRNNLIIKNEVFSPFAVIVVAAAFQNRNHFHQEMASQSSLTSSSIRWTPPPQNIVKMNFDGLVLQHDSSVAVGDSALIIDCVTGRFKCPWKLLQIVQDIKMIASSFSLVFFHHVLHEANFAANALANLEQNLNTQHCWESNLPSSVRVALNFDLFDGGCQIGGSL